MRHPIRTSPWVRPLLVALGATRDNSYVEIDEGSLHARFGPHFDERFPLADVRDVQPAHWPLIGGIGWRTNFAGTIGLIGSTEGVLRIRLRHPKGVRLFFLPQKCRDLFVSFERPDEFAEELRSALASRSA